MVKDSGSNRSDWYLAIATIVAAFIIGIFTYISNKPEEHVPRAEPEEHVSKTYVSDKEDAENGGKDETKKTDFTHPIIKEQSAHELSKYLESLPPLQMETVIKEHYISKWVAWSCDVSFVRSSSKDGHYIVGCTDSDDKLSWAFIEFPESYYEQIQNLRKGDKIFYHARIDHFVAGYYELSDGELLSY